MYFHGSRGINITLDNSIRIPKSIPRDMINFIQSQLTFPNPKFFENIRYKRSNYNVSSKIVCYKEDDDYLIIPRGYYYQLRDYFIKNNINFSINDQTIQKEYYYYTSINLRDYQENVVMDSLKYNYGIISAPPGSGKTIMALKMLEERHQKTLIIVHSKELLNQWKERILSFFPSIFEEDIGIIGDGKYNIEPITVALVQSLSRTNICDVNEYFGLVIVDECHRIPSAMFSKVIKQLKAKYLLGLSATPYRRDGLNKLLYFFIGNIVSQVDENELIKKCEIYKPILVKRETDFFVDFNEIGNNYGFLIKLLIENEKRNQLIISDILKIIKDKDVQNKKNTGIVLILSERKSHCYLIQKQLMKQNIDSVVLEGSIKREKREEIVNQLSSGKIKVLISTIQLIGEGFDCPNLSYLFLTTPIKYMGRLKQCLGRILRKSTHKKEAIVFDYVDEKIPVLKASFNSRLKVYK